MPENICEYCYSMYGREYFYLQDGTGRLCVTRDDCAEYAAWCNDNGY